MASSRVPVMCVLLLASSAAVVQAQPFIQGVVPSETSRTLTINGLNFGTATGEVSIGPVIVSIVSWSPTQVVTSVPSLVKGSYTVVLNQSGQYALANVALGGVGPLTTPPLGTATPAAGFSSDSLSFTASTRHGTLGLELLQRFSWQVDPIGNNTTTPRGRLRLRFAEGTAAPVNTGLAIEENGRILFASGQTFPGVVTSVAAGAGLVSSGQPSDPVLSVSGITSGMIADGTIQTQDIGNGQIALQHLSFDPTTQAELDTHKVSADHDSLYYTKAQADSMFLSKHTTMPYAQASVLVTPSTSFTNMLFVGVFTKERADSDILLTWNGSIRTLHFFAATNYCEYQLRLGSITAGNAGRVHSTLPESPAAATALFTGLAAGTYSVNIWGRGNADQCWVNVYNRTEHVVVEESGR